MNKVELSRDVIDKVEGLLLIERRFSNKTRSFEIAFPTMTIEAGRFESLALMAFENITEAIRISKERLQE